MRRQTSTSRAGDRSSPPDQHSHRRILAGREFSGLVQQRIGELATKHRIVAASNVGFPDAGGVIGYGPSVREMDRRGADFVDRTPKGAKPGDLPIEQSTRFQLVINARAAKVLDVTVPQAMLLRADRVIR